MIRPIATVAPAAVLAFCIGSCATDDDGTVRVFAASSLTDAFGEIVTAFEAAHPGVDVELNLAGSSALREQIVEGAPSDVFASADEATMGAVVDAGEIDGTPTVFALNRLVVAVPAGNPAGVAGLGDLADPDLLVGICAAGVPCGDAARDVLANSGVVASVDTNEPNVRSLAAKIADRELDVGLVYATDVAADPDLFAIEIDDDVNVVTAYPIAPVVGAADGADAFVAFVLSEEGRAILAAHGFGLP